MFDETYSIPYCGTPPLPSEIWTRWNADPVLIATLCAVLLVHVAGARSRSRREAGYFTAGWLVLVIAWVSPLCNLSVALFSARVTQHMLVVLVAAPLLLLGMLRRGTGVHAREHDRTPSSHLAWRARFDRSLQRLRPFGSPAAATALFTACLWLWHVPDPYRATFESDLAYWAMHLTLLASAMLLWRVLLQGSALPLHRGVLAGLGTVLQMGLLGAVITLAPRVLYEPHLLTTHVWGLSPLEDQQLGGLIMWVPGCSVMMIVALLVIGRALRDPKRYAPEAVKD